jgi:hypothetical protein
MVTETVATEEFGETNAGLKVHPASAGNPVHEKATDPWKEPCGVTVTVNDTELPAITVAVFVEEDSTKSGVRFTSTNAES